MFPEIREYDLVAEQLGGLVIHHQDVDLVLGLHALSHKETPPTLRGRNGTPYEGGNVNSCRGYVKMSWLGKGPKVSPMNTTVKCSGRVGIFCQLGKKDAAIILLTIFDTPLSILI